MTPKSNVTSLELSQKLRDVGVKHESMFYYADGIGPYMPLASYEPGEHWISAFTSDELIEILGDEFRSLSKEQNTIFIAENRKDMANGPTPAEALGNLLLEVRKR